MTPLETLKEQMVTRRLPYFTVKYNGKEIDRQDSKISPGEAADQLENLINSLDYDRVTVEVSGRTKDEKAEGGNNKSFTHVVQCGGRKKNQTITGHEIREASNTIPMDMYLNKCERVSELERLLDKKDVEIERLKDELKKANEEDKTMQYLDKFAPIISGLFSKPGIARPVSQAVAGTPEEISEKLSELMERWAKADKKKLLETIDAIVKIAENDPKKYKMYQSMLLS